MITQVKETLNGKELYLLITPTKNGAISSTAEEVFAEAKQQLKERAYQIFSERIYAVKSLIPQLAEIRARVYTEFADELPPVFLEVPEGINGTFAGLQIHAIRNDYPLQVFKANGECVGRHLKDKGNTILYLSKVSSLEENCDAQAKGMFENVQKYLSQSDLDMHSVARTWIWLKDILNWYSGFNKVRNNFFTKNNLINPNTFNKLPASTGISITPYSNKHCALDLIAVSGPNTKIEYYEAGGNQESAYNYGSAFSRATKTTYLAGKTIFVSGTASIDANGVRIYTDNPEAQISETIKNVKAIFDHNQYSDEEVMQAIVYCKTPEIEKLFLAKHPNFPWPYITVIADVCFSDLFFEIEALAIKCD
jgi:enamine deaminase RidA (YjgF/YER057c/UK114 family)